MKPTDTNFLKTGLVINNKWVILEFIAKGGMGEIYRAHQLDLKRDVAIKVISQNWLESLEDEVEKETGLQRFRREVQAMAKIQHPNVITVYDYGTTVIHQNNEEISIEFIVMEYLPGGTLRSTIDQDGFYPDESVTREWIRNYFLPVINGVRALHEAGIIHRDLKPENIFMADTSPKVADFGLARSKWTEPVTRSMDVFGSPVYMAPEQFFDLKWANEQADIYSLGKILYEAVEGATAVKSYPLKSAHLNNAESSFFKAIDQIVRGATAENKENRIDSVNRLHELISRSLKDEGKKSLSKVFSGVHRLKFHQGQKWRMAGVAIMSMFILTATAGFYLAPTIDNEQTDSVVSESLDQENTLIEQQPIPYLQIQPPIDQKPDTFHQPNDVGGAAGLSCKPGC
jgi:eukaryotic-like serine/threonine-protein kinase